MTARVCLLAVALSLVGLAARATPEGLGDAAARERARRAKEAEAKKPPAVRSFDDQDLEKMHPAGEKSKTEGASAAAAPTPEASGGGSEGRSSESPDEGGGPRPDERAAAERPYQEAVNAARERVSGVEARLQELRDKLNPMSVTFIYGTTQGGDAVAEEMRTRQAVTDAEKELAEARQALTQAEQALTDFQQGRAPREQRD